MVKPIMKDILFPGQKSEDATEQERQIIADHTIRVRPS